MNKLGKMNKPKRFHFVSFSFEIFSAKLISINNFQNCKKSIHYFKENCKTINNNHQIRALAVHKTDIKPIQSRDNVIIDGRKSRSHCVVTRFIEFIDVDLIAWQLLNDY